MDELQSCELCFQPVGPFYQVRILPATPLDFCGGTMTPPHARIPGEHKIACHTCRYTFTNLESNLEPDREPCSSEEPPATFPHLEPDRESNLEPCSEELADHVEDEPSVPIPVLPTPTPTLIGSPARPSRSHIRTIANNRTSISRYPVGEKASQRAPPCPPDTRLMQLSRAPPI